MLMTTGNDLRNYRETIGLSQAKLSEITGLSQHILSAFELGKTEISQINLKIINDALIDKNKIEDVKNRTKRYQNHIYKSINKSNDRVLKHKITTENEIYTQKLDEIYLLHQNQENKIHSALSLFSGCGGFSLGFSAGGFKIKGFLELENELRDIYKQNFSLTKELGGDISNINDEFLESHFYEVGNVDVIIGGPPCQGFSLSGKRQVDDPRNSLFLHYLRFVDVFKPKIAILENVRLLTSMKNKSGGYVKDDISSKFQRHGYKVQYFEVNAKDYGVPQHRERVFFVALREDISKIISFPEPKNGGKPNLFYSPAPFRTFADACSDLKFIESGEESDDPYHVAVKHPAHVIEWLWDVPEGRSAHDNEDPNKRPPSGYNTTYKRQIWDEPASTVQTTFGMISGCRNVHPIATRSLTIREAARIQSFPDKFKFTGTLGTIRKGIGNAVPPLLAYELACFFKEYL